MALVLISGSAHPTLGAAVASALDVELGACLLESFPDGEIHVDVIEPVRGHDVYLLQPLIAPAAERLMELLLLANACRRAGAATITAMVPYLAYARQDRRETTGEALGARLVAELMGGGRIDRVMALDLHSAPIEGCFDVPVEHLSAVPLLTERLAQSRRSGAVVVAPDLGAAKLAERYARALQLPVAIVHKTRLSGTEVSARRIVGDVRGCAPIIVDDMISTGATIAAAVGAVLEAGGTEEITVAATHALLVGPAIERLRSLPLRLLLATDSIPPRDLPVSCEVVGVAPLLAEAIRRGHATQSTVAPSTPTPRPR